MDSDDLGNDIEIRVLFLCSAECLVHVLGYAII